MHIGQKIKQIVKSNPDLGEKELADSIGVAPEYIWKIYNKDSIKTELLEKILATLGISLSDFFNESYNMAEEKNSNSNYARKIKGDTNQSISIGGLKECLEKVSHLQEKISLLEKQVKDKEEIIELLKK